MEDRLVLGLTDAKEANAPRRKFDVEEKGARLNIFGAFPLFIASIVALVREMFIDDEPLRPSPEGSPFPDRFMPSPDAGTPPFDDAPVPGAGAIGRMVAQSDAFAPAPMGPLKLGSLSFQRGRFTDVGATRRRPTDIDTANDNRGIDGHSGDDIGSRHVPTPSFDPPSFRGPVAPPSGGGTDPDSEIELPEIELPDGGTPTPPGRANRRPILSGPVQLNDGMVNVGIVITMAELLDGASDPDGDALLVRFLKASSGQLQRVGVERWLFTPDAGDSGEVTFTYQISDGTELVTQTASLDIKRPQGATIEGTEGDDLIVGTPLDDAIDAKGGDDIVYGRESRDVIIGGSGNDRLIGGAGDDVLWGNAGDDILFGGLGDDTLFGEDGNDTLHGEDGNDILIAAAGDDHLFGGAGNDHLDGGTGADRLQGDAGADVLDGGEGDDTMSGGDGDDRMLGSAGADTMTGDAGADVMSGGDGDDDLDGGDGNDVVSGDAGDDRIAGGAGNDRQDGGDGDDTLLGEAGADEQDGGDGDDHMSGGDGDDRMDGSAGTDAMTGDAGNDVMSGGEGDDDLDGGAGSDTLTGDAGDDTLSGGEGDDILVDGAGIDRLDGGAGDDILAIEVDGDEDMAVGGAGIDTIDLSKVVFDADIDLPDGWVVIGGRHEARLFEIENVRGGSGNDRLVADDHVNILVGGAGNDIFVFRSLDALQNKGGPRDHILDFQPGDRIDLSHVKGEDDFGAQKLFFAGAASASAAEIGALTVEHRFVVDAEITVVKGDLGPDDGSDFEIVLEGRHVLTEQDFILAARQYDQNS